MANVSQLTDCYALLVYMTVKGYSMRWTAGFSRTFTALTMGPRESMVARGDTLSHDTEKQ